MAAVSLSHEQVQVAIRAICVAVYGEQVVAAVWGKRRNPLLPLLAGRLRVSEERIASVYYGRRSVTKTTIEKWGVNVGIAL